MIRIGFFVFVFFFLFTPIAWAGHQPYTVGWYCENNNIMYDVPDADATHQLFEACGDTKTCVEYENPPYNRDARCDEKASSCSVDFLRNECTSCGVARSVSINSCTGETSITAENVRDIGCDKPDYCEAVQEQSCAWNFLRNECTGCGTARSVEHNTCSSETRISQENVSDAGCFKQEYCEGQEPSSSCTWGFLRNECTGCGVARSVEQNSCTNETRILQEGVEDGGCNKPEYCASSDTNSNIGLISNLGSCAAYLDGDLRSLIRGYKSITGKPVWVTEIGFGIDDKEWQAEYLRNTFNVLRSEGVPVTIWYGWNDSLTGGDGINHWGLFDTNNQIKPAGSMFRSLGG